MTEVLVSGQKAVAQPKFPHPCHKLPYGNVSDSSMALGRATHTKIGSKLHTRPNVGNRQLSKLKGLEGFEFADYLNFSYAVVVVNGNTDKYVRYNFCCTCDGLNVSDDQ